MRAGKAARALLAAALLTLDPRTIGMLAAANMLAPDGRCKTLDAGADGCGFLGYKGLGLRHNSCRCMPSLFNIEPW